MANRNDCIARDAQDARAPLRAHFDLPQGVIYLDGNSPFMDMQLVPAYAGEGADQGAVEVSARVAAPMVGGMIAAPLLSMFVVPAIYLSAAPPRAWYDEGSPGGGFIMTKITVLPHPELAPEGATIEAAAGTTICAALLEHGIEIEHACGQVGACTTCHVVVASGFGSLNDVDDNEEDMLDRAWGLQPHSRLSCQAVIAQTDLTVEIPLYTLNLAKEKG